MNIIELTNDKYDIWDDFCLESKDTWFWHTSDWIEYTLNYNPSLMSKNHSFLIEQDNKIKCICPLLLEYNEKLSSFEFSFGGGYNPNPAYAPDLTSNQYFKLEKFIFKYIDEKAKEFEVKRAKFTTRALSENLMKCVSRFNPFLQYGYLDNSIFSTIVDLKSDLKEIWSKCRKRIKRAVNSMKNKLKFNLYNNLNCEDSNFDAYKKMHFKAAGKLTRPQKTWDLMKNWILNNKALLASAELNGEEIGFALFIIYKKNAYYGSGANDPDKEAFPIAHCIFWKVIEWLKENNFNFYEVGEYTYPSLIEIPSEKENNIANFKLGFGGDLFTVFQGEKYFSKDIFQNQIKLRGNNYCDYLDKILNK